MKYLAKVIVEVDYEFSASSTDAAVAQIRRQMQTDFRDHKARLHGVVRADIGWPDTSTEAQRPPPKGGPPSGTPGVGTGGAPLADQQEEFVFERAAA